MKVKEEAVRQNEGFELEQASGGSQQPNKTLPEEGEDGEEEEEEERGDVTISTSKYVYEPSMSLHRTTIWEMPVEDNYTKKMARPSLSELMNGAKNGNGGRDEEEVDAPEKSEEDRKKEEDGKMGWINGVMVKCLLTIWGVMLFLRLSWVVGQSGLLEALVIITIANVIIGITALSMSAVATNGRIEGGGVYYLISRSLGPELGGAIGLMFTLANAISVATYTIGFCDNMLDLIYDQSPTFHGIVDTDCQVSDCRHNDLRILGTPVLVFILVLAIVGQNWVSRVDKVLLVILLAAQVDMFAGSFVNSGNLYVNEEDRYSRGFTGWSLETAKINTWSRYGENGMEKNEFMDVFGVFFTAVTGITAGANMSGDLKDPSSAIPKGTLIAIGWTYVSYFFFAIMVAFTYLPQASGDVNEWQNITGINSTGLAFDDCSLEAQEIRGFPCEFGAAVNQKTIMYISFTGWLVFFGCYAATLSSAIGSFVGAPRVLQALGKDKIYPVISYFGRGRGASNEPVRGYFAVFTVSFCCLMIASLNIISSLASNFFLAAYALINFSVFHSSMTKSPGWRPSFKYYNPWLSLVGTIMAVGAMISMDWKLAAATFAIVALFYGITIYLKPEVSWGSSAEALKFVSALNNTHALNDIQEHAKTYRPKILLLSGNPAHRKPLIDFTNLITKKLSLLIATEIIDGSHPAVEDKLRSDTNAWLKDHKINGFYTLWRDEPFVKGFKTVMELTGLGKMSPNMVMIGYKADRSDIKSIEEYVEVLLYSFENNYSVGILRCKGGLDYSEFIGSEETVVQTAEEVEKEKDEIARIKKAGKGGKKKVKLPSLKKKKDRRVSIYRSPDGSVIPYNITQEIEQFKVKQRTGTIDVWWLYDDGGLTILLPHILQTRRQFRDCNLRVFSLSNNIEALDTESVSFANLLHKFRIEYSEVIIVPGIMDKVKPATRAEFETICAEFPEGSISKEELVANSERTNRNLRLSELLREHSRDSELVVMTLPLPRRSQYSSSLYLAWLEALTRKMDPPILLTRGNQASVLTFYS